MAFAANAVGVHRLCGQRNDKMSTVLAIRQQKSKAGTQRVTRSLVLMSDNEGTDSHAMVW